MILEDAENQLTIQSRQLFSNLLNELQLLDERFKHSEQQIKISNQENEVCQRLDDILGIGAITSSALYAAAGNGKDFVNGRHFSAWMGLVPRQYSTGGKNTLLGISR